MKTNPFFCGFIVSSILVLVFIASIGILAKNHDQTDNNTCAKNISTTKLTGKLSDGTTVEVYVDIIADTKGDIYIDSERWGTANNFHVKRLIKYVTILVNAKSIPVPVSAYSDLSNTWAPELTIKGLNFSLIIKGGDGICGYEAVLMFSSGRLTNRKVVSLMSPDEGQETRYFYSSEVYD